LFFTDYVVDIYDTLTTSPKEELKSLAEDLKEEVPAPLHTMLVEKESKEEAITKYRQRKEKEAVICPPTCTEEELHPTTERTVRTRRAPHCKKCGKPLRGHKKGQCG